MYRFAKYLGVGLLASVQLINIKNISATEVNSLAESRLGEMLYNDINLSLNRNQSCESCHSLKRPMVPTEVKEGFFRVTPLRARSFVDTASITNGTTVSDGSMHRALGRLNAPSIGYAAFSPDFYFDGELFIGGQFWNGRAATLEEQAAEPFLDETEMAMSDELSVIERLAERWIYRRKFNYLYGIDIVSVVKNRNPDAVSLAFDAMTQAIAAFERTAKFNQFTSKFDFEAAGMTAYNDSEQRGADLFDGVALCGECHVSDGIEGEGTPALLTDFSYDNLGVPANPQIPGQPDPDPGLLGNPNLFAVRGELTPVADVEGRHKVMSLRNIALTPPYMHNGVFKTLEEVVHFYNTRDVLPKCTDPADATNPEFGKTCWPEGEFHATRNVDELGNLGLSEQDEADLVAYLKTFTDNYPEWGNKFGLSDPNVPKGTPSPFRFYPIPGRGAISGTSLGGVK